MNNMSWVRGFNASVGLLAPHALASTWRRAFMTPRRLPPRDWELPLLEQAERITLRFGLSALRWGSGPAVLLMHGWEGRPTQFAELIKVLVKAGYGVVALDAPAHGRSMGGASALLATQLGLRTEALISISAPSRILSMLGRFSRYMGLPRQAREHFVKLVEENAGIPAGQLDSACYQLDIPGLVVHAADDPMVPFSEAEAIHQNWFDSRLLRLENGGHQRLLADPRLLQAVLELLEPLAQRPSKALAS